MRGQNDLIRMLRDILTQIEELKTVQPVGTNQIVAKPYETADPYDLEFTVTAPGQGVGSSFKVIKVTVTPENITPGNILLSDIIPEIRYTNGVRVSNWNSTSNIINFGTYYFVVYVDPEDDEKNTYLIGVIAPTNTVMRLKMHITANSDLSFTLQELN